MRAASLSYQRPYSARLFLVIVAIILIVIGIGFFMMLFTQ